MKKKMEVIMAVVLLVAALSVGFCGIELPFLGGSNPVLDPQEESLESHQGETGGSSGNIQGETGGSSGNTLEEPNTENLKDGPTVVLDPGHGADDPGKVGVAGSLEKEINLAIALKLKDLLEAKGIFVVMTRMDDSPLYAVESENKKLSDMKERIRIIQESGCDIVVSIHQNSYTQSSVRGPQVFYYTGSTQGERLAACIQKGFDYAVGQRNTRSIKKNDKYYLLTHVTCPLVIAECGFLSNPEEESLLRNADYQESIAVSICNGIIAYFGLE